MEDMKRENERAKTCEESATYGKGGDYNWGVVHSGVRKYMQIFTVRGSKKGG